MASHVNDTEKALARLQGLFEKDPEKFEQLSQSLIRQTIESFPERFRARAYGIQFRIDAELSRCSDPVTRLNRMVEIFWEGFRNFQDAVNDPEKFIQDRERGKSEGKVLHLGSRATKH